MTQPSAEYRGVGLGLRWAFIEDVVAGDTPDSIRFFEVSPENYMRRGGYFLEAIDEVASRYPLLTHGLMLDIGGMDDLDPEYLLALGNFVDRVHSPHHSDHLCWTGHDGRTLHDLFPLPRTPSSVRRVVDKVKRVQDRLGRPFALENISYYTHDPQPAGMDEAEFIASIVELADCQLMLDVNNVDINARNHGFDSREFIERLPLERVIQMHVAGGHHRPRHDDLIIDTHGSDVRPEVVELMTHVLERIGPVPVIYERDHAIPPLEELGAQIEQLERAYQSAVDRFSERAIGAASHAPSLPEGLEASDGQLITAMSEIIASGRPSPSAPSVESWLTQVGQRRLAIYHDLVHDSLLDTSRKFMERTAARLGARFERDFATWLADPGPRSKFLRDCPGEFLEWVEAHWRNDPEVPSYIVDLARHEQIGFEVGALPDRTVHDTASPQLGLESILIFDPAVRICHYAHAVHELPEDPGDRSIPEARSTTLLVYRDDEHDLRYLSLTAFAEALTSALLDGRPLGAAVRESCDAERISLEPDGLGRAAALLSDFVERKIIVDHRSDRETS